MTPDSVTQTLVVHAPLGTVYDTVGDVESYPEWLEEFKQATVLQTRPDGWVEEAAFVLGSMGMTMRMTLAYTYTDTRMEWQLVEADIIARNDGAYDMVDNGDGTTTLTYELAVEVKAPIPALLRRRVAKKTVNDSLKAIKARAEA